MNTSKRVNVSTTQKTTETLEVHGWDLTFNYEQSGNDSPQSVSINGIKKEHNHASVYVSKTNTQLNVVFNNDKYDGDLVEVMVKELDLIMPSIRV
jgi:hypothetical protein